MCINIRKRRTQAVMCFSSHRDSMRDFLLARFAFECHLEKKANSQLRRKVKIVRCQVMSAPIFFCFLFVCQLQCVSRSTEISYSDSVLSLAFDRSWSKIKKTFYGEKIILEDFLANFIACASFRIFLVFRVSPMSRRNLHKKKFFVFLRPRKDIFSVALKNRVARETNVIARPEVHFYLFLCAHFVFAF